MSTAQNKKKPKSTEEPWDYWSQGAPCRRARGSASPD